MLSQDISKAVKEIGIDMNVEDKKEEKVLMDKKTIEKYRKYAMRKWDDDASEDKYCPEECVLFGTAYGEPVGMQYLEKHTHPHNCNQIVVGPEKEAEDYFIWPNLFNGKGSAIITVPDREDVREKIKECRKKGIKTHVVDFSHPETSSRYNPFLHIKETKNAGLQKRAEILAEYIEICLGKKCVDPFWEKAQKFLLRIIVLYNLYNLKEDSFKGLLETVREICDKTREYDDPKDSPHAAIIAEYDYSENKEWSEFLHLVHLKTFKELLMCFAVDFQIFDAQFHVGECFNECPFTDNIDITKFGTEQHYLFIIGSDKKPYSDLASLLIITLFEDLLTFSETRGDINLPCHVHFYLDGFKALRIPDFTVIYGIIRKYNINFSVMIESPTQFIEMFPSDEWLSVTDCAGAILYFGIPENLDENTERLLLSFCESINLTKGDLITLFNDMKTKSFESGNEMIAFVYDELPIICDKLT